MGVYLSKANTVKDSSDGGDPAVDGTCYGVSAMQGWRQNMEDAHVAQPDVPEVTKLLNGQRTAVYGVFDGHGGPGVSGWVAKHLDRVLTSTMTEVLNNAEKKLEGPMADMPFEVRVLCETMQRTFLRLDVDMQSEENRKEIKAIHEEHTHKEPESHDPVQSLMKLNNRTLLQAILNASGVVPQFRMVDQNGEHYLQIVSAEDAEDDAEEEVDEDAGPERDYATMKIEEMDNDDAKEDPEKASRRAALYATGLKEIDLTTDSSENSGKPFSSSPSDKSDPLPPSGASSPRVGKKGLVAVDLETAHIAPGAATSHPAKDEVVAEETPESVSAVPHVEVVTSNKVNDGEINGSHQHAQDDMPKPEIDDGDADKPGLEDDDGISRTAYPMWSPENCGAAAIMAAVIETPTGPYLITANAGDSRCVFCRNGKAVGMSQDHKPALVKERERIAHAGGEVISGRVDGNLNLSRTLGDLFYKSNNRLNPEEQKITAFPDIRVVKLSKDDEFVILACDGIWDCVTNDEAVQFVRERLENDSDSVTLSKICEGLCDRCLASNPTNSDGGIGCDNMTCVIVKLNTRLRSSTDKSGHGLEAGNDVDLFEGAFIGGRPPCRLANVVTEAPSNVPQSVANTKEEIMVGSKEDGNEEESEEHSAVGSASVDAKTRHA